MFSFSVTSIGLPFNELKNLPVKTTLDDTEWKLVDLVLQHHPQKGMILQGLVLEQENAQTFVPLDKVSVKQDCICIHMDLVEPQEIPEDSLLFSEIKNATIYTKDGKSLSAVIDAVIQADITIDFMLQEMESLMDKILQRKPKETGALILNTRYLESISSDMGMLSHEYSELEVDRLREAEAGSSDADMRSYRDKALRYIEKIEPITTRKNM